MLQVALDKRDNDIIWQVGGGIVRVIEGRFVVQQVQCKLKTFLGEWILDTSVGWVNREDFEKNYDKFDLEDRARKIIIGTQGVLEILYITSTYNRRRLEVQFEAKTIYGIIKVDVPWDFRGVVN